MTTVEPAGRLSGLRSRLAGWVESPRVQSVIIALIVLNALLLGLETFPGVMRRAGTLILRIDAILLGVFVIELAIKMLAHGGRFFRSAWNVFDLLVVGIALLPATGALSVLRALRVLRVLRLVSAVPKMRFVVESLVRSLPGMGSIALLLLVFFYVFAVMGTKLFGAAYPQWFGTLGGSLFSLFQIMTLEGWADIAREIMLQHPAAWIFFLGFILLATFTVLNLFIAVIVNAMQESHAPQAAPADEGLTRIAAELQAVRVDLADLRRDLAKGDFRKPTGASDGVAGP